MYIDEGKKKFTKRKANRPNLFKGSRARIPSQTIGRTKIPINSETAIPKLKDFQINIKTSMTQEVF